VLLSWLTLSGDYKKMRRLREEAAAKSAAESKSG
jgi:hypothetical protein